MVEEEKVSTTGEMRLINAAPSYKTKKSIQRIYSLSMELAKELRTLQNDLPTFSAREDHSYLLQTRCANRSTRPGAIRPHKKKKSRGSFRN